MIIIPLLGCVVTWLVLYVSTHLKTEREDVPETHYQIPLKAFLLVGGLTSALIYGLSFYVTGVPLLYFSGILVLLLAQATIDFRYKEIALEWIGVSLILHVAYIIYERSYSHHMLGYVLIVFLFLLMCSLFAGLGVGDTLLLTAHSILFYPGTFDRAVFSYIIGLRWFFLVFAIPQVFIWLYFAYRKRRGKAQTQDTLPFIPFYTTSFVVWLFGMVTGSL